MGGVFLFRFVVELLFWVEESNRGPVCEDLLEEVALIYLVCDPLSQSEGDLNVHFLPEP